MGRTADCGIRRSGALNNLPMKLSFGMPERFANARSHLVKLLGFSPACVDSVETCSYENIHEAGLGKPLAHGLDRLRMVVRWREHVQSAQNFHLNRLLVGEVDFLGS